MEIVALASAPLAAVVVAIGFRTHLAQAMTPVLFLLMVGGLALTHVCAVEGRLVGLVAASTAAAISAAGLIVLILRIDTLLAERELEELFWGPPRAIVGEALYSLEREGRAALLIYLRRDSSGHLLDATAFDPEEYV